MNYETIITIICLILAITVITVSFRFAHWRNRAEAAEQNPIRLATSLAAPERKIQHIINLRNRFDKSSMTFAGMSSAILIKEKLPNCIYEAFEKSIESGELSRMLDEHDAKTKLVKDAKQSANEIADTVERRLMEYLCGPGSCIYDMVRDVLNEREKQSNRVDAVDRTLKVF